MRPIESYVIYLAMYAVWHGAAPLTGWAAGALALATAAHIVLEYPRWQLTAVYCQVAYLLTIFLSPSTVWPAGWYFILSFESLLLLSSAVACLFPVAKFPTLNGPYQTVGTEVRFIHTATTTTSRQHGSRARSPSVDLGQFPEIGVSVFYPSSLAQPTQEGAIFLTSKVATSLGKFVSMPSFLFSALPLARTRAVPNVPLIESKTKLPVIIFSHGLGGVASMYSSQCSELASQGYVVFAPTHLDGSSCLAELRGSSVKYKRLPDVALHSDAETTMRASQLRTRSREIEHILDSIVAGEKDGWNELSTFPATLPPYAGQLDLTRVSLVGHSFGAATVLHAAADPRVHAVIAHDLWCLPLASQTPPAMSGVHHVPLLFTISDQWNNWRENMVALKQLVNASKEATLVHFKNTRHSNYSDVPMFSQFVSRKLNQIGSVEFREAMNRINQIQIAFLAKEIKCQPDEFERALKKTPGVAIVNANL